MDQAFVTTRHAASVLDSTPETIRQMVRRGELRGFSHGRLLKVTVESLEAWIAEHLHEANGGNDPPKPMDFRQHPNWKNTKGGRGRRALLAVIGGGEQMKTKKRPRSR
jgi:excisionase family DNA binding protein